MAEIGITTILMLFGLILLAESQVYSYDEGPQSVDGDLFVDTIEEDLSETPNPNSTWPWMATINDIKDQDKLLCVGTIINMRYILTAAHCLVSDPTGNKINSKFQVSVGGTTGARSYNVTRVRMPGKFDASKMYQDIALLRTKQPMRLSRKIWPMRLPDDSDSNTTITGTLTAFTGNSKSNLREVTKTVVELKTCADKYKLAKLDRLNLGIIKSQICVASDQKNNCKNILDGAPILAKYGNRTGRNALKIVGVINSHGSECVQDSPLIYTRVDQFLPWIRNHSYPNP